MYRTCGHRGRTASYPTGPAQIPACGIIAPGSSEALASAKALGQTRDIHPSFASGAVYDIGFHHAEFRQKLRETFPIVALALAAPVEIPPNKLVSLYVTGCYFASHSQEPSAPLRHSQSPGHTGCILSKRGITASRPLPLD